MLLKKKFGLSISKNTKKLTIVYNDAVEEALCFGWIDSTIKRIDDETYKQKFTPRKDKSVWSLVNKKRAEKMIREKKMAKAGLKKIEIAKKNGQWEKAYTSKEKIKMPDYLEKALKTNETAWKNFNNFANSYRNQYIGWVISAKREETRAKRIATVIDRSEKNLKPPMM